MKINYMMIPVMVALALAIMTGCKKQEDEQIPAGFFDGSFDNLTSYPAPELQLFLRKDGKLVSLLVYPGQVVILSPTSTASEIGKLVSDNNGTINMQVPQAGLYLATVDEDNINPFIQAMWQDPAVADAFPNAVVSIKEKSGNPNSERITPPDFDDFFGDASVNGDKNSLIQTIDVSTDVGCTDNITHMQAVANVAGAGGISVNINDVTLATGSDMTGADYCKSMKKTLEVLNYAHEHNLPVVINMSLGGIDTIEGDNYWYYRRYIAMLQAVEMKTPHLLDNAVLFLSAGDISINETSDITYLDSEFPGSPVWDHIYVVGSSEGESGCGMGYADNGTAHYLSAPACNIPIPNSPCPGTGNSVAVPQVSSLVAQTYKMLQDAGQVVIIPEVSAALWQYQTDNYGQVPTVTQLFNYIANVEPEIDYSGTWSGTFYYTAEIPQPSGPPQIVNTSLILTITLEDTITAPGYAQMLIVKAATCSDPTFGATMAVTPDPPLSIAFLPFSYGLSSEQGMGIIIVFPNGSKIFTTNFPAGAFIVSADGQRIESTALVANTAFSASGTVQYSNEPGSGPGGYAYNWCTFKSWFLNRL